MKQKLCAAFFLGFMVVACTGGASDTPNATDGGGASSSSSTSSSSSGGPSVATPQVIFDGRFEQAADGGSCTDVGALAQIGAFGANGPSTPVKDNEQASDGGLVRTSCSVKRSATSADAFDVQGSIAHSTMGFTISGVFRPAGEQTDLRVRFTTRGKELAQIDDQCFARYTTVAQGVAAGRVWAEVECPSVTEAGGGNGGSICRAIAQIRFENCAQ